MTCNCKTKCKSCCCGAAEGERLKREAMALFEARRETYVRRGRRALLQVMLDGDGTATADDVYGAVELPADIDPRCLGSVPGALAYRAIIRHAGFIKSSRPERHRSWLQVWKLIDRTTGESWLRDNSDLPDPANQDADKRQGLLFDTQETATPTGTAAGAAL